MDSLLQEVDRIAKDKGIDRAVLVDTLEAAILTAARRTFGQSREIEAKFNEDTGQVELFQIISVVREVENPAREVNLDDIRAAGYKAEVGEELLFPIYYLPADRERAKKADEKYGKLLNINTYNATFGRIAAQTAKQVIIQRMREAERDIIYNEFKSRVGEMVTGMVRRFEKGDIIIDLGRTDAILPRREQMPKETYRPGDRVQAMIKEIRRSSRDPQVLLTRADPQLLFRLFAAEVPEIYDGIVRIVAVAREPGVRSKVAVYSRDSDVDPVGACVGMRGSRVQAVVQELRGEKIDIVPYVEDTARFVCNAISPAEVSKVLIDETNMTMELIVPDDQLSLAIGRGGQNVRLAAQLTGWNLDIISETRLRNMMMDARNNLLEFEGVTEDMIDTLFSLGYNKLEHIANAEISELAQIPGYTADAAERIIDAADEILARPTRKDGAPLSAEELERKELELVRGVGEKVALALYKAGFKTIEHLAFTEDPEKMAEMAELPLKKGKQIQKAALDHVQRAGRLDAEAMEARRQAFLTAQAGVAEVTSDDAAEEAADDTSSEE
jgi:N utilization substance protein A